MSVPIINDNFRLPPIKREPSTSESKQNFFICNEKSTHSLNVIFTYVVNYIATVKGDDVDKIEDMVSNKKFISYEKKYHPVYLKFLMEENKTVANFSIQKLNTEKDQFLNITYSRIDKKNVNYVYIVTKAPDKICVLVFNVINKELLKIIRSKLPEFASDQDMQINRYSVPDDLTVIVKLIYLYCLPGMGNYVTETKNKLESNFKKIFAKQLSKFKETKKVERAKSKSFFNLSDFFKKSVKTDTEDETYNDDSYLKSQSIDNLLVKSDSHKDIPQKKFVDQNFFNKTNDHSLSSTQSSLNDSSNELFNPLLCKFENLLQNERGLKWFKDFLTKEVSSENILFWEAVHRFRKIEDFDLMKKTASEIYFTYMDENSVTPVNLDKEIVENVENLLNNPNSTMFSAAETHIFYLMKTDKFNRFRSSPYFHFWNDEYKDNSGIKPISSTSSLNRVKRHKTILPNFFRSKPKNAETVGTSSQTLDFKYDESIQSPTCKITMLLEYSETHCVEVQTNKKLIHVLKHIDKQFPESEAVAFDEFDNMIVPFSENMVRLIGRSIIIERRVIIRIGYVHINMERYLFEYVWFVIRPRYHLCLSNALNPVANLLSIDLEHFAVVKEEETYEIPWNTQIYLLNKCCLFLIEHTVLNRAKFYQRSMPKNIDLIWKKISSNEPLLSNEDFNEDNVLDSRNEIFSKYKFEPRKVGYILTSSLQLSERFDRAVSKHSHSSYDDDRSYMPDFVKTFNGLESDESSSLSSKNLSDIFICDSDLSFSERDELSDDNSMTNMQLVNDLE